MTFRCDMSAASRSISFAIFVISLLAGSGLSLGQQETSPESMADLNEGIRHYLLGKFNKDITQQAIDDFTRAIEREKEQGRILQSAILFRAIAHGQAGLIANDKVDKAKEDAEVRENVLALLQSGEPLEIIVARIDELERRIADAQDENERRVLESRKLRLSVVENFLNPKPETPKPDISKGALQDQRAKYLNDSFQAAGQVRESYQRMSDDLKSLIESVDRPETVLELLDVVAQSKIAKIDEDLAVGLVEGITQDDQTPDQLRANSKRTLQIVGDRLEKLYPSVVGEDSVRARFFLGVIRFREGVPKRAKSEEPPVSVASLESAAQIMTALADDPQVENNWRSYAALYLGLIYSVEAQLQGDAEGRDRKLDEAEQRLMEAVSLDVVPAEESGPTSFIPQIVDKQLEQIDILRTREPAGPGRINDLEVSVVAGAHRDTNVVLLGERTDLPRDISRERDFGFNLGTTLDYTTSLDESNRLTLGLQGRVSQLWHADVDEFDEQLYGASAALQYELMPEKDDFGPLHLRIQYDYDYTLLGRDDFLGSHALTPNLRAFWAKRRAETNLYWRLEWRDYLEALFDRRFDRDGEYNAIGILQSYDWVDMTPIYEDEMEVPSWGHPGDDAFAQDDPDYPDRYLTPRIGLEYDEDSTDGDEFDQDSWILSAGVDVPLPWGLWVDASVGFEWQDYWKASLVDFHRNVREDFIQRYDIGLSRTFVLRGGERPNRFTPEIDRTLMTFRLFAAFTHDDSNVVDRLGQAIFEYDRTVYGLTVRFTFN